MSNSSNLCRLLHRFLSVRPMSFSSSLATQRLLPSSLPGGWAVEILKSEQHKEQALSFVSHHDDALFLQSNVETGGLIDKGETFQGTYVGMRWKDSVRGILCHCWNGMLLISAEASVPREVLLAAFVLAMDESPEKRETIGIMGEQVVVTSMLEVSGLSSREVTSQTSSPEVMLRCTLGDLQCPDLSHNVTRATAADIDELTDWGIACSAEALGIVTSDREAEKEDMRHLVLVAKTVWVLRIGGSIVSTARINASSQGKLMIGGVFTPQAHRNKGYAKAVVARMLKAIKKEDAAMHTALLFADHPFALKAYRRIGFTDFGKFCLHIFQHPVPKSEVQIGKIESLGNSE